MKPITLDQLKQIARANGQLEGWDFSRLRFERAPTLWDYVSVVRTYLKPSASVLDIGTGGGEIFLSLAPYFGEGVGIDQDPAMVATARRNQAARRMQNVAWLCLDGSDLGLQAEAFDLVLLRHLQVYAGEILRVLRPGGVFITQMVGQRSSLNILEAFGWTPASFGPGWWQPVAELAEAFRAQGCGILAQAEYDVPCWYKDLEGFLFWLMAVPWPEDIDLDQHWQAINRVLETSHSERGIQTNEHRGLLVVRKSCAGRTSRAS